MVLWANPSIYVEIVSSSSLINPGTYSEANWLHWVRFLGIGEADTSVVGEIDKIFVSGGTSILGRILIESECLDNPGEIFLSPFFSLKYVILLTFRRIFAGLMWHIFCDRSSGLPLRQ